MYTIPWDMWWRLLGRGMPVKVGLPDDPADAEEEKPEGKDKDKDKDEEDADQEDGDTQPKVAKTKGRGKNDDEETPKGKAAKKGAATSPSIPANSATSGLLTFTARMREAGLAPREAGQDKKIGTSLFSCLAQFRGGSQASLLQPIGEGTQARAWDPNLEVILGVNFAWGYLGSYLGWYWWCQA